MLLHLGLLLLLLWGIHRAWVPFASPGVAVKLRGAGGGGGGGGGSGGRRVEYITLPQAISRPPAARTSVPASVPTPTVPPRSTPPPVPQPAPISVQPPTPSILDSSAKPVAAGDTTTVAVGQMQRDSVAPAGNGAVASGAGGGSGGGAGGGQGGGVGPGVGAGAGGGSGSGNATGQGGRATPPEPRQLVLPPSEYPKELRGRTLEVTFWVDARGAVEHIKVVPAIEQGGFAKKFEETMRNYRFRPARSAEGTPVAGSLTVKVDFLP